MAGAFHVGLAGWPGMKVAASMPATGLDITGAARSTCAEAGSEAAADTMAAARAMT